MKIIEFTSVEEFLITINNYLKEGALFPEKRFYFLLGDGSQGISGDPTIGFNKISDGNLFFEVGAFFFPKLPLKISPFGLLDFLVEKFEAADPASYYDYSYRKEADIFMFFCNNSFYYIKVFPDYGVITVNNLSGVSFDAEQKDLSQTENKNSKNILQLISFIDEYSETDHSEENPS